MADPAPTCSSGKWLWPVVIALLALLLLFWLLNPSGDRTGEVEDPIVTGDVADPGANAGAGPIGDGLPATGAGTGGNQVADAPGDTPATLTEPVDETAGDAPREAADAP